MKKKETMDDYAYYTALGYIPERVSETGGQALILADIMACLGNCRTIHIPFPCPLLEAECAGSGMELVATFEEADAVYWGTPTVVDDKALFPDCLEDPGEADKWTKERERTVSKYLTAKAEAGNVIKIVTGLGTGDISVNERIEDMGGGRVVSHKHFDDFEDWVIMRRIEA